MEHDDYCVKEAEIATLQNEQEHFSKDIVTLQEAVSEIDTKVNLILQKLNINDGIATSLTKMETVCLEYNKRIRTLEEIVGVRDGVKTRKSDFSNFPVWKKITVLSGAVSGVGILMVAIYYVITYAHMLLELLKHLPK